MFYSYIEKKLYSLAGKISKLLLRYQKKLDLKKAEESTVAWEKLFVDKEFFIYSFSSKVKIRLYNDSILSRLIYEGFEKEELRFVMSKLEEGDIFIDIGANIGMFSLIASEIVGERGLIMSYEPSPKTYMRFEENIKLNKIKNIVSKNVGLSNENESLTFYMSERGYDAWNSFAPSLDNKLEKEIKVPVRMLDAELADVNKSLIKFVKIDVEGWEKFVLLGGELFFKNYRPVVMVEFTEENTFNAGYSVYEIYDIMANWGYEWYRIIGGELVQERKRLRYPYVNLVAIKRVKHRF